MKKLVLVTLALVMIVSLSMGAVSAGWYGDVYTSGNSAPSSKFHGVAGGTKYLSQYTGHGLVKIGIWNGSSISSGIIYETTNLPYSGTVYFEIDRTETGSGAYCLSEVKDSDGRTYTQDTYH